MQYERDKLSLKSNLGKGVLVLKLISVTLIVFFVVGCGGSKNVKRVRQAVQEAYEIQKPIQVQTSLDDKRPEWTKKTSFETDEGMVYFTGGFQNGSDYSVTIRCANAEALKSVAQALGQFIRSEFSSFVQGPNTGADGVERYVEDGIATFTRSIHVQGVHQNEVYYEEVFSPSVMQPTFNAWVKIQMSKADFMKAKADVLRRLRDDFSHAGETEAKEKAEELLKELKREAESYGA